ncbi:MAG: hypothetical protein JWO44_597 [Bacteroidetes bacterium]|nr:hypothetical protein [Bacteroidota bacterium]
MIKRALSVFTILAGTLLLLSFVIPQPLTCPVETYDSWNEHTSGKTISRELRKAEKTHPRNYKKIATILFSTAYLNYLQKGVIDTLTFQKAIEAYKSSYSKVKSHEVKSKALYMIAMAYYYMGDARQAEMWFAKTAKTTIPYSEYARLGLAKCLIRQNNLHSADSVLSRYSEVNRLQYDSLKRMVVLDIKNGH